MSSNWRGRWALAGWTPYYYFRPDHLDGPDGHLRTSTGTWALGLLSLFLWLCFILSFSFYWLWFWDWLFIVWIVFLCFICIEWTSVGVFMTYVEPEVKQGRDKKEDPDQVKSTESTKNMPVKSSNELKSLKMQL